MLDKANLIEALNIALDLAFDTYLTRNPSTAKPYCQPGEISSFNYCQLHHGLLPVLGIF